MNYQDFLKSKQFQPPASGIAVEPDTLICRDWLFPFQGAAVAWAVGRGRASIWFDTGLGKTRIQVAWLAEVLADNPDGKGLILAPLAVARQTIAEAALMGVGVTYVHDQAEADAAPTQIMICNYDRLHLLDASKYLAVALDESSILKAFSGKTKRALVKMFKHTLYRLSLSATPAPNDINELCNHAEFLGIMSSNEMRSTFFINDNRGIFQKYRLKKHAESAFYEWLASWAIACRHPSDLGFDQDGYDLPGLNIRDQVIDSEWIPDGQLFAANELHGIGDRISIRKATVNERVGRVVQLVEAEPDEQWIIWCGMNDTANKVTRELKNRGYDVVNVQGNDDADVKADNLIRFADGDIQILVTKPSIAGMGLNLQRCARMAFIELSDSYESYYQAIRRCWRFGQNREVDAHIVLAAPEQVIAENVRAKEATARATVGGLIAAIATQNRKELFDGTSKGDSYEPTQPLRLPEWMPAA